METFFQLKNLPPVPVQNNPAPPSETKFQTFKRLLNQSIDTLFEHLKFLVTRINQVNSESDLSLVQSHGTIVLQTFIKYFLTVDTVTLMQQLQM